MQRRPRSCIRTILKQGGCAWHLVVGIVWEAMHYSCCRRMKPIQEAAEKRRRTRMIRDQKKYGRRLSLFFFFFWLEKKISTRGYTSCNLVISHMPVSFKFLVPLFLAVIFLDRINIVSSSYSQSLSILFLFFPLLIDRQFADPPYFLTATLILDQPKG